MKGPKSNMNCAKESYSKFPPFLTQLFMLAYTDWYTVQWLFQQLLIRH